MYVCVCVFAFSEVEPLSDAKSASVNITTEIRGFAVVIMLSKGCRRLSRIKYD